MDYLKLEKNICDTIKEGQIKIGYSEESVRLFYPMESISELLKIEKCTIAKMQEVLADFKFMCYRHLGQIEISNKEERFCFLIPQQGTKYVNEIYKDNHFLRQFIQKITKPNSTLYEILDVFHTFSKDIYYENNNELGHVIYFQEEDIDEYVYCLKFDEFGATYHRFTKEDYQKFL